MKRWIALVTIVILLAQAVLIGRAEQANAAPIPPNDNGLAQQAKQRVSQAERQAAADRAKAKGGKVATRQAAAASRARVAPLAMGAAPHYYGPYPNYANSPLRMSDAVIDFTEGGGSGAAAVATVDGTTGAITAVTVTAGGSGYTAPPAVNITSPLAGGSGAAANATITNGAVTAVTVKSGGSGYLTPGTAIRKFVDDLPLVGPSGANKLGQYIPVAVPDITTYPGSDYYEIGVVQYREKMHSDLPATLLRGYVQLSTGVVPGAKLALANDNLDGTSTPITIDGKPVLAVDRAHYLGPLINATRDKPVRILFRNLLPTGQGGDLFLPVDTTVMGSGMGPDMGGMMEMDPQNPMCDRTPKPAGCYAENRATLHLHGGITPWISDGTPHQWITPAGEKTTYPKGVSVENVPDMPDPGPGAMTFFYSNQQSARLLFYHDHSWGITRLNVYAGEAAPYIITDPMEQSLISAGTIPADQIPLVIQDKTFVPSPAQLAVSDPTWNSARWGGEGNLWLPHVYMPAQNPGDSSGVNQFGRWAYGPWFWPPTNDIQYPPIDNPYYDPQCDTQTQWCEPPKIPGVPYLSMGMESFHDTPLVNGTAYPTVTLQPKSYRFRVLNAANDRFFNLQLYKADASGTEVKLDPALVAAALTDPTVFPTPDMSAAGPDWIQIGTEGGFLPAPVVIPAQPITWVADPTVFNAGNVDKHSLLLGPAERVDVIVDLSKFAGQTLILYNDAPAAFPARDPRYDYYTGNPDLRDTGGAASTLAGYGPNTRTVMQIKVASATPDRAFDLAALETAFKSTKLGGQGVFENAQNPIIVGQGAYNSAYGSSFRDSAPLDGFARITDFSLTFNTLLGQGPTQTMTMPFQPKAIQDEMGEAFEQEYGRMSGNLGLEVPLTQAGTKQNLILYPYVNPASEILKGVELPAGATVTPISTADDGTQIWKITHNGVDTHPIHWHLFDVQLLNRVGWDGIIRPPDANELGWKDTLRVSPLEDTIVALRPIVPKQPFGLPDSVRPLNPMMPLGSTAMFNNTDANANPISPPIVNKVVNFGWEYVWHCHILSHEEMDMMRPISVNVSRSKPATPALKANTTGSTPIAPVANLSWSDGTPSGNPSTLGNPANEIGFRIERNSGNDPNAPYTTVATALANQAGFTDTTVSSSALYRYRVIAFNAAGETVSNIVSVTTPAGLAPKAPTNLVARVQTGPKVDLTFKDNSNNETGFVVERADNGGAFAAIGNVAVRPGTGSNGTYSDTTVAAGNSYDYRVKAVNGDISSDYSNTVTATIAVANLPLAPSSLVATIQAGPKVALAWTDNATNETGFVIERAVNGGAFAAIGNVGTKWGTGNVTYTDSTTTAGNSYDYRVKAVNGGTSSAYSNKATVTIAAPVAPSNLAATAVRVTNSPDRVTLTWTDNSNNETGFTIQRATDAAFTAGLNTQTVAANATTASQSVPTRNVTYYYRIQANGSIANSDWSNTASVLAP